MPVTPSASFSLTLRIRFDNEAGVLGEVTSAIGRAGGSIGAVDIVQSHEHHVVRDIAVDARSTAHSGKSPGAVESVAGVEMRYWDYRRDIVAVSGSPPSECGVTDNVMSVRP